MFYFFIQSLSNQDVNFRPGLLHQEYNKDNLTQK